MTEFSLIDRYFRPLTNGFAPALDLRDDAAAFPVPPMHDLVVTKDLLISGVHFIGDEPASMIAQKALRVNLSDLFAKGALPYAYALGLALPRAKSKSSWWQKSGPSRAPQIDDAWMADFAGGLAGDQKKFGIHLLGGDTTSGSDDLVISITAFGLVPKNQMIKRSGAKPGDVIFVTATIGDAGLGLGLLQNRWGKIPDHEDYTKLHRRYWIPEPRAKIIAALRQAEAVTASADISDGLIADLGHILAASGVGARLETALFPLSDAAKGIINKLSLSLEDVATFGDDYEIVFTVPANKADLAFQLAPQVGISITRIGMVTFDQKLELYDENGNILNWQKTGYQHRIE